MCKIHRLLNLFQQSTGHSRWAWRVHDSGGTPYYDYARQGGTLGLWSGREKSAVELVERLKAGGRSFRLVGPTFAAGILNQLAVSFSQLAVIPALVRCWGVADYGVWLLLTAIPVYLTISDFGFTTSAKVDMSLRAMRGDIAGARVTASSVAAMLALALLGVGIIYLSAAFLLDWVELLRLGNHITSHDASLVLAFGFLQLASYQASLLSAALIRAAGRPALEVLLSGLIRILEATALVAAAMLGGGFVETAAAWAIVRCGITIAIWIVIYIRLPHLAPIWSQIDWRRVRTLLRPSVAFLMVPLANAISIQGTVLVLGMIAGPAVVAVFSTMRVVTRLGVSAANTLNFAFTPQYSYAVGKGDKRRFQSLRRVNAALIALGTVLFLIVMALLGPWFVRLLSRGAMQSERVPLALLSIAVAGEMIWGVAIALGSSVNKVGRLSIAWLVLATASIGATLAMGYTFGAAGAAGAVAMSHLLMVMYVFIWWYSVRHSLHIL